MIKICIEHILCLLSFLAYLWILIEAVITAYFYYEAGKRMKSEVIKSLSQLFSAIGVCMVFCIMLPVFRVIDIEFYLKYAGLLSIPLIPIAIGLRRFREKSLKLNSDIEKEFKK